MYIDELIERLQDVKVKHGNIRCVEKTQDLFGKTINSTIETVRVVDFLGRQAVKLDWRTD